MELLRRRSFDALSDWHERVIAAAAPGVILAVVANKCDIPPSHRAVTEEVRCVVRILVKHTARVAMLMAEDVAFHEGRYCLSQEGRSFARSIGAIYAETSAKTGEGVSELFENFGACDFFCIPFCAKARSGGSLFASAPLCVNGQLVKLQNKCGSVETMQQRAVHILLTGFAFPSWTGNRWMSPLGWTRRQRRTAVQNRRVVRVRLCRNGVYVSPKRFLIKHLHFS